MCSINKLCQHLKSKIGFLIRDLFGVSRSFGNVIADDLIHEYQLSFLQIRQNLRIAMCPSIPNGPKLVLSLIYNRVGLMILALLLQGLERELTFGNSRPFLSFLIQPSLNAFP